MAIKAATLCSLAVLIGSAVAGDDMMYLDQATEQSLAARHINHGRMWQVYNSNATYGCVCFGTLVIMSPTAKDVLPLHARLLFEHYWV